MRAGSKQSQTTTLASTKPEDEEDEEPEEEEEENQDDYSDASTETATVASVHTGFRYWVIECKNVWVWNKATTCHATSESFKNLCCMNTKSCPLLT